MRKLFKERKLIKGGNYMRKYGICFFGSNEKYRICFRDLLTFTPRREPKSACSLNFSCLEGINQSVQLRKLWQAVSTKPITLITLK